MRLIDADELIKEFDPDGEQLSPITVRLKIARQPTAYDVNEVLFQLEEVRDMHYAEMRKYQLETDLYSGHIIDEEHGQGMGLNKAIEIVKGG